MREGRRAGGGSHFDGLSDVVDGRRDDDRAGDEEVRRAADAAAVGAVAGAGGVDHAGAKDDVRPGLLEARAEQDVHGQHGGDAARGTGAVDEEDVLGYDHARDLHEV